MSVSTYHDGSNASLARDLLRNLCDYTDRFMIMQTVELSQTLAALVSKKAVCLLKSTTVTLRSRQNHNGLIEQRNSSTVRITCWHILCTTAL